MNSKTTLVAVLCALVLGACATHPDLERHVGTLASRELGGRLTGSDGARAAAAYISDELRRLGAVPLPDRDFAIPFEFAAGTKDAGSTLSLSNERFVAPRDVQALSFSNSAAVTAPAVFAGYGLVVPEALGFAYDSYAGLDVRDKIVVVLRYFPEDLPEDRRAMLSRHAGLRYKAMLARERGAAGIVIVTGPRSPNAGKTVPMAFDAAVAGSGIVAASVSGSVGEALFEGTSRSLADVQASLDAGDPHATGFALASPIALDVRVMRERRLGHNVVGMLAATRPPAEKRWVVVGAHYDHLGTGSHGNSLARDSEQGAIHYGADDNASGVAAVLRIGELAASAERGRHLVLAFWSGEEMGLLGSSAFLTEPVLTPAAIAANLNFDMVGRARNNRLALHALGTSPAWSGLVEEANQPVGFDLSLVEDPYLPTDSASFDRADVPTLNFFSGPHVDYHRPTDTANRLDYDGLERVARLGAGLALGLANAPEPPRFVRVERSASPGPGRDAIRAFTGTIPDYAVEAHGLALAGVVAGGPAAEAGLREGDVIVKLGPHTIANIYDYTYALDVIRIGEPVEVAFVRDGERRSVQITPRAR